MSGPSSPQGFQSAVVKLTRWCLLWRPKISVFVSVCVFIDLSPFLPCPCCAAQLQSLPSLGMPCSASSHPSLSSGGGRLLLWYWALYQNHFFLHTPWIQQFELISIACTSWALPTSCKSECCEERRDNFPEIKINFIYGFTFVYTFNNALPIPDCTGHTAASITYNSAVAHSIYKQIPHLDFAKWPVYCSMCWTLEKPPPKGWLFPGDTHPSCFAISLFLKACFMSQTWEVFMTWSPFPGYLWTPSRKLFGATVNSAHSPLWVWALFQNV